MKLGLALAGLSLAGLWLAFGWTVALPAAFLSGGCILYWLRRRKREERAVNVLATWAEALGARVEPGDRFFIGGREMEVVSREGGLVVEPTGRTR